MKRSGTPVRYTQLESPRARSRRKFILWKVLLGTVCLTVGLYYLSLPSKTPPSSSSPSPHILTPIKSYPRLVSPAPACIIPEIPLSSAALDLVPIPEIIPCDNTPQHNFSTLLPNGTLLFLPSEFHRKEDCCVFEVNRPYNFPPDSFKLKPETGCLTFGPHNELELESEFLMVQCGSGNGSALNFHARVLPQKGILASKAAYWARRRQAEIPVNVMVFVLDSTSSADAFRSLPKTMSYLLNELKFLRFPKFHGLGEATLRNALPLLMGVPAKTFYKTKGWGETWDHVPLIWDTFNESNYATSYMEDVPSIGTFNYGKQGGYVNPPTTLYLRPLFSAWETLSPRVYLRDTPVRTCLGPRTPWQVMFDYQLEILKKLNGRVPTFTMPWPCWPFHDFFRTLSVLEEDTLSFFRQISAWPEVLENTVMLVMADHAFYNNEYAWTHTGLLERRLPLFLIRLPERLRKAYPAFQTALEGNAGEVTSHYDVYKTLRHLAALSSSGAEGEGTGGLGQSLLRPLPTRRSCQDAGVGPNLCACGLPPPPGKDKALGPVPKEVLLEAQEPYVVKPWDKPF